MDSQRGFASIVIILIAVVLLGVGAGSYILVSKDKSSAPPPPLSSPRAENAPASSQSNKAPETEVAPSVAANPKELFGWWEEIESWSIDPQSGNLKKAASTFPFLHEFTDRYFCTQYSAKFTCANNISYSVNGKKILLEGSSDFYEWRINDGRLELVSKDSKGRTFNKSLSKKIGSPTSIGKISAPAVTQPGISSEPKAKLTLLKVGTGGLCLKHEGGDSIPMTDIYVKLNGKSTSMGSFEQFPSLAGDYIFDPGEFFVIAISPIPPERFITFHVGDTVEITNPSNTKILGPITVERIEPEDEDAFRLIGGLASCP